MVTKDVALEALTHCVALYNPFGSVNCGAGCPLWKQCTGTDLHVILSRLEQIILDLNLSADKILSGIRHCIDEANLCNDTCPYWTVCRQDDVTFLFRDIYYLLTENRAYEKAI